MRRGNGTRASKTSRRVYQSARMAPEHQGRLRQPWLLLRLLLLLAAAVAVAARGGGREAESRIIMYR